MCWPSTHHSAHYSSVRPKKKRPWVVSEFLDLFVKLQHLCSSQTGFIGISSMPADLKYTSKLSPSKDFVSRPCRHSPSDRIQRAWISKSYCRSQWMWKPQKRLSVSMRKLKSQGTGSSTAMVPDQHMDIFWRDWANMCSCYVAWWQSGTPFTDAFCRAGLPAYPTPYFSASHALELMKIQIVQI